ncbi:hypothetical protein AB4Z29_01885 [Paenibacillus sp. 2TAB23]|uniref:hypothetical protein n=1 Tax=Paenibacillus sp. 2TAB23 TaxID=3233004 RepID=UPI003F9DA944
MGYITLEEDDEQVISSQSEALWERRALELEAWADRDKVKKKDKLAMMLDSFSVDAELYPALVVLRRIQIPTEYCCAGVSVLDDPFDHSVYAYMTFHASKQTESFVEFAANYMKHRVLVTYEPACKRYDLSSFFIGHNRSFCLLMHRCAEAFAEQSRV